MIHNNCCNSTKLRLIAILIFHFQKYVRFKIFCIGSPRKIAMAYLNVQQNPLYHEDFFEPRFNMMDDSQRIFHIFTTYICTIFFNIFSHSTNSNILAILFTDVLHELYIYIYILLNVSCRYKSHRYIFPYQNNTSDR